jgi:glycosyltransferase involved in cell wall biosynthesis
MKHSVIMPAYNAARYIEQSVGSALAQLGATDEIIIVDDGSTDATVDVVASMSDSRIQVLCQSSNQGIAAARNRGLEVVSGDYVHFLDHDDLWSAGRMQILLLTIKAQQPDIISGWVKHFYCDSLSQDDRAQYHLPVSQAAALPGSVVMRRELIKQVGEFDSMLSSGEFIEYLSRAMVLKPKWVKTDHVLFLRRIHGRNHTLTDATSNTSYLEVIRRHLARYRSTGKVMPKSRES